MKHLLVCIRYDTPCNKGLFRGTTIKKKHKTNDRKNRAKTKVRIIRNSPSVIFVDISYFFNTKVQGSVAGRSFKQ